MKKIGLFLAMASLVCIPSISFATATKTSSTESQLSTKLETNKTKLLNNLDESKRKLQKISREANNFSSSSLFRAVSCIGALPQNAKELDANTITTTLRENILNEYIGLDGEIKRLKFGISMMKPDFFTKKLDNYFYENSIKINNLEQEYSVKINQVKEDFLAYVKNNEKILVQLAQNLEYIDELQEAGSGAQAALKNFRNAIDRSSTMMKTIENNKADLNKAFATKIDQITSDLIKEHTPNAHIQAKILINKENFLKKFASELDDYQYYLYSAFFSYAKYNDIITKQQEIQKRFFTTSGAIDCNLVLTSNLNFAKHIEGVKKQSEDIQKGLNFLANTITSGRLNLKMLEIPSIEYFIEQAKKLEDKLLKNYRIILNAEINQKA